MAGKSTRTIARSSKTGRIVTTKYAKTHPATTVVERVGARNGSAADRKMMRAWATISENRSAVKRKK